jgi:hypothetical protein
MLVDDLADAFDAGVVTTGHWFNLIDDSTKGLLKELNQGIADFAITKFHELLYGKYKNIPLTKDAALKYDIAFINAEQGEVAYGIYSKYKPDSKAIKELNQMARKEGALGVLVSYGANGFIPSFADYGVSLDDKETRYGENGRKEIPILMLYPEKYSPTSTPGLVKKTGKNGTLTGSALTAFLWAHIKLMNAKY